MKNLIVGACALCGFALSASAETVGYWDPVGKVTNSVEAVVVTGVTATLAGGWYVVRGEVSRAQINVTGTDETPANLILADGAILTVTESGENNPGIRVESGKTLNIYAQSTDANAMGRLSATSDKYGAGIGGGDNGGAGGEISISGGRVTATGGGNGAGIGGGNKGTGGDVTISGGSVVAKSGNKLVWDIGSGSGGGDSGSRSTAAVSFWRTAASVTARRRTVTGSCFIA